MSFPNKYFDIESQIERNKLLKKGRRGCQKKKMIESRVKGRKRRGVASILELLFSACSYFVSQCVSGDSCGLLEV